MERLVNPRDLGLTIPDGQRLTEGEAIKMLQAERDALRAQLTAAQEWRPVSEPPPGYGEYIVKLRAFYNDAERAFFIGFNDDGEEIYVNPDEWRPAPKDGE